MKILAVDPGLKKIGLAMSDSTGTVARALTILNHQTLVLDKANILAIAGAEGAEMILLGTPHETRDFPDDHSRFIHHLLAALRSDTSLPVELYDESFSTKTAQQARRERGDRKKARRKADDALAAAAFLQEYLDAHANKAE